MATFSLPNAAITAAATTNLITGKSPGFEWRKLNGDKTVAMTDRAYYYTDGQRVLIDDPSGVRMKLGIAGFSLILLSIAPLGTVYSFYSEFQKMDFNLYMFLYEGIGLIVLGLILMFFFFRGTDSKFYVFDRNTGLVHLPKRWRQPAYVLPFEQVELYGARFVGRHGLNQYRTYLHPKLKPTGTSGKRGYQIHLGENVLLKEDAESYWAFLNAFMDKTQPVPEIFFIKEQLDIYRTFNKTLDDLPFEGYDAEKLEAMMLEEELKQV